MQIQEQLLNNGLGWCRTDEGYICLPHYPNVGYQEGTKVVNGYPAMHGAGVDRFHTVYSPYFESFPVGSNSFYSNPIYTNDGTLANSRVFMQPVTMDDVQGFSDFPTSGTYSNSNFLAVSAFQPIASSSPAPAFHDIQSHATCIPSIDINVTIDINTINSSYLLEPLSQSSINIPSQITLSLCPPQIQAGPCTNLIKSEKQVLELDPGMAHTEVTTQITMPVQPTVPSTSPSPAPSSPLHHSLVSVFSDDAILRAFIAQHIPPNDTIRDLAFEMIKSIWLICNELEPRLSKGENVVKIGLLVVGKHSSRFEVFFDGDAKHRCRWMEGDERCTHTSSRKNRAIGHAHAHFNYKPFACDSKCGNLACRQRFTCVSVLNGHIQTHRRSRASPLRKRVGKMRDFKRQLKQHN